MDRLKEILNLKQNETNTRYLVIYILLAYLFSLAARLLLYYQISDNSDLVYAGNIIPIWTPDAGLYGYYAKQLLSGVSYPFISEYMPGYLLYGIVNLTGLDLDTVLFFAPAFFSSLIVIPIILIAHCYKLANFGLYAALIGSLMTSYYYRTHLGYYDTDILNAVFPLLSIYFLIKLVKSKKLINAVYASLVLIAFSLWYHSSAPIILSIVSIFALYTLIYERTANYAYQSLFILAVSLLPIASLYKIILLIILSLLFLTLHKYKVFNYKHYLSVLLVGMVVVLLFADISKYYERVDSYINKSSFIEVESAQETLKLKSDLDTVAEAQSIDMSQLIHRISGATPFFILALFGYIALLVRYRSMLLTLPLALLTFIAIVAGLRFTIYGVMIFSFAMVFGVHLAFKIILVNFGDFSEKISNITSKIFLFLVMAFALNTIMNYNKNLSPLYFSSTEDIEVLHKLKESSKNNDFIVTWWDYGWPLWYYTKLNTLIDNGKHKEDNFIVSKILLSENETFAKNSSIFFIEKYREGKSKGFPKAMVYFAKNYPMEYLEELKKEEFKLPSSKSDIYIMLHKNMLSILEVIESFSNLDLETGENYRSNYTSMGYLLKTYDKSQDILQTQEYTIDLQKGEVSLIAGVKTGNIKVRRVAIVEDDKIKFRKSYLGLGSSSIVIYNDMVLMLKPQLYNSFLIQALLFNNYNHDYFTKVSQTKNFVIFKVNK